MSDQIQDPPEGVEAGALDDEATEEAIVGDDDALVDEMDKESFPGSDAPSTWAGPDRPAPDLP